MSKIKNALFCGAFLAFASAANATTITVQHNGVDYDVTTVTGTFNDLSDQLDDQIWWGNAGLANVFASAVGTQLGAPPENTGVTFSSWAPFFATGSSGTSVFSIALDVGGTFGFTVQGPSPSTTGTHTYAIVAADAAPVPLPAGLGLMLSGFGAFGLMRMRRKSGEAA